EITQRLFGTDDHSLNQLDWLRARARHTILLLDTAQSVRPADIEPKVCEHVITETKEAQRWYPLETQMRVKGGKEYLDFARAMISNAPPTLRPGPSGLRDRVVRRSRRDAPANSGARRRVRSGTIGRRICLEVAQQEQERRARYR